MAVAAEFHRDFLICESILPQALSRGRLRLFLCHTYFNTLEQQLSRGNSKISDGNDGPRENDSGDPYVSGNDALRRVLRDDDCILPRDRTQDYP